MALRPTTTLSTSVGLRFGDASHLRALYGLPQAAAALAATDAYSPRAGLYEVGGGANVTHALGRQWIVFGGGRIARLVGPAGRSPLVDERYAVTVLLGIAYRCC